MHLQGGAEHIDKDAKFFEVASLVGNPFDVAACELAAPSRPVLLLQGARNGQESDQAPRNQPT